MGRITNLGKNMMLNRMYASSPTYTVPSQFGIGTGTTSTLVTDTELETPVTAWSGGTDYKNFDTNYPAFDTTKREVTIQGTVVTTEASGNELSEAGTFNTDGTPSMDGRATFTAITKTSTDNVIFIIKRRVLD